MELQAFLYLYVLLCYACVLHNIGMLESSYKSSLETLDISNNKIGFHEHSSNLAIVPCCLVVAEFLTSVNCSLTSLKAAWLVLL
mgnify:FL=1